MIEQIVGTCELLTVNGQKDPEKNREIILQESNDITLDEVHDSMKKIFSKMQKYLDESKQVVKSEI